MNHQEQLAWEKRVGVYAAVAAFASALMGAAGLAAGASARGRQTIGDTVDELFSVHRHNGTYLAQFWLQGISIAVLAGALYYLYRATRYRRPQVPGALNYLSLTLPVLVGGVTVVNGYAQVHAANKVARELLAHPLFPKAANKLADHEVLHGTPATIGYIGAAFGLALAFVVGMISINARRAGLLSGFMGVLGAIVGALLVLGGLLQLPPIVQYFWVTALGLLFLNRWPGQQGRGPAWDSGEEEPWPTAAELRAERTASGLKSDGRDRPPPSRGRAPEPVEEVYEADGDYEDEDEEPQPAATPHPRSKKRKRKRRR